MDKNKYLTLGILAHVDAGKTTLSEGLLYTAGALRRLGRVDHGDAFLDTDALEKERGITIFSKQAVLDLGDTEFTLLDTPGHVDFSSEMERTLAALDYAILVISGSEGVQSHTETLWKLLAHAGVPTFLFVNKMDISHFTREEILRELHTRLDPAIVDFTAQDDAYFEALGSCDEVLMDEVLETGQAEPGAVSQAILQRHVFTCVFGAALKMEGVAEFLDLLQAYTLPLPPREAFEGLVFKITEDEQGNRLTHLKLTGGTLHVRETLSGTSREGDAWEEKIAQIRMYSGAKFTPADEVHPGQVCALTGLNHTYAGEGLGAHPDVDPPLLEPILRYAVVLPPDVQVHTALIALKKLEQEDPQLHVSFSSQLQQIHVLLMGEIQQAVLQHMLEERFGIRAEFAPGGVAYKETIASRVEGMGHYEPLRHYAEVRLLLEPGKPGSGLELRTLCREDALDRNWQRLILTHLREKEHLGVLTGSPITDIRITLTAGRAHKKHTEGGDFRQATYRTNVMEYTRGRGRLSCTPAGYAPCADADAVIARIGYDPEADLDNSPDSIFCSHGSGDLVKWNEVAGRMHTESFLHPTHEAQVQSVSRPVRQTYTGSAAQDKELMEIFERTYGSVKRDARDERHHFHTEQSPKTKQKPVPLPTGPEYLLVDGYNIIFAWEDLKKIAADNLDAARAQLIHILANYRGWRQCRLILVFDAYRVKGNPGSVEEQSGISIVYTKEAETADTYIERISHELAKDCRVRVATSDGTEQIIILGNGAFRMSAEELRQEVREANRQIAEHMGGIK